MQPLILEFKKETDNKVRWDTVVEDTTFELYIFKWRVPVPRPSTIRVNIIPTSQEQPFSVGMTPDQASKQSSRLSQDIFADVVIKEHCTKTIRYRPVSDSKECEIGEPYIPFALTHDKAPQLRIHVVWGQ